MAMPVPDPNARPPVTGGPVGPSQPQQTYGVNDFNQWATQRYGRAPTEAEYAKIGAHVGAPTANGAYSAGQFQSAQTFADQLATQMGWKAPGAAAAPAPTASTPDPNLPTNTAAQTALQQLIATGNIPSTSSAIDTSTPAFQAQRANFDRQNEASTTRARLASAERAAAGNTLGTGGFSADQAGAENAAADRKAQFEADLYKGELQDQRSRVMQALELATQSGNAALSRQLQEKLGLLDNQLRNESLKAQTALGKGQLSLGLLQALLGDQRAKDALGFNYANLGVNANQNFMNSILNGF